MSRKKSRKWGAYGAKPKQSEAERLGPKYWELQKEGRNKGKVYVPGPELTEGGEPGGMWVFPDEARKIKGASNKKVKHPYLHKGD